MFAGGLITTDGVLSTGHRFSVCINASTSNLYIVSRYQIRIAHGNELNNGECSDLWAIFEANMRELCVALVLWLGVLETV
jgi:hypothetical protein